MKGVQVWFSQQRWNVHHFSKGGRLKGGRLKEIGIRNEYNIANVVNLKSGVPCNPNQFTVIIISLYIAEF